MVQKKKYVNPQVEEVFYFPCQDVLQMPHPQEGMGQFVVVSGSQDDGGSSNSVKAPKIC